MAGWVGDAPEIADIDSVRFMGDKSHDAMLFEALDGSQVRCNLCAHRCVLAAGKYGICRVRRNVAGALKSMNYEAVVAAGADPIEKKPLFHFLPGTRSFSIAAVGCNFQCEFCQNWRISQAPRGGQSPELPGRSLSSEQIVAAARDYDCASISYTYTEPTVFFELAYDTARLAKAEGLKNCFVSNGYMTPLAVETIAPYLDAINVDLTAFRDETYKRIMKARLDPVLDCLKALRSAGIWIEVTTLIVPRMNDSDDELGDIARFIAEQLGEGVPWHVSRFHGDYQMSDASATPIETLTRACSIGAQAGLKYVYCGNATGFADESTHCCDCGEMLIERVGFDVREIALVDGACPSCGQAVEGVWK